MSDSAICYGDSGSGKTSVCVSLAKWMYENYGLLTRLISCDNWDVVANEGLIKAGIVQPLNLNEYRGKLLSTLRKLARGEWITVKEEEVPIVDENGIQTGSERKKIKAIRPHPASLEKIGLYFIETTDGICDLFMKYAIDKEIIEENERGQLRAKSIGPQPTAGRFEEDGEVMGSNSEGHYNVVQTEIGSLKRHFDGLGGGVKLVFWTGHVGMGKEGNSKVTEVKDGVSRKRRSGNPCYCPLLVGEAKNALVPGWFGDCFHLEESPRIFNSEGQEVQARKIKAWIERHQESGYVDGVPYLAKSRVAVSDQELLQEKFPNGYIELGTGEGEGLDQYYSWLNERKGGNVVKMKKWKEEIDAARNTKR